MLQNVIHLIMPNGKKGSKVVTQFPCLLEHSVWVLFLFKTSEIWHVTQLVLHECNA